MNFVTLYVCSVVAIGFVGFLPSENGGWGAATAHSCNELLQLGCFANDLLQLAGLESVVMEQHLFLCIYVDA